MSLVPPKLSRANRNSSPAATKSSSKPSSHHSTQPGVIKLPLGPRTLPQHGSPTALSHSLSSESPSRRSRPRRTRLAAAAAATNKPLVASLVDSDDTHSDSPPTHPSTPPTPSPAKNRRRGRANRQKSPPNAGEDVVDDRPTSPASSPFVAAPATPPPISDARPSLLSQSAPIALPATLSGLSSADHSPRATPRPNYHHDSSADEWDMPASAGGKLEGHTLTWQQQQALRPHSSNHSTSITTPRRTRTESASLGRVGGGLFRSQNQQRATRPPLSGSVSDSAAATTTTTGLTWQQELLQSSAPSAAASPFSSATAGAVPSPSKLRRQLLRDEMTFGGGSLSLNSPSSSSDSASVQFPIDDLPSPVRQPRTLPNGYSTPTKGPAVERYAGSNFMNSPSPSSLPAPSFLLRRAPVVVAKE